MALLGNEPKVMPPLELVVGRRAPGSPRFATYRVKNDSTYRTRWRVRYREPRLGAEVLAAIEDASRKIFSALKLRDYARIDYRLTPDNELYFLEANPNPDLTRHTFGRDRCFAGVSYPELIASIVDAALSAWFRFSHGRPSRRNSATAPSCSRNAVWQPDRASVRSREAASRSPRMRCHSAM